MNKINWGGKNMLNHQYSCYWTKYRIVTSDHKLKRLLKVVGSAEGIESFMLKTKSGILLDEEQTSSNKCSIWHFGFWIAEKFLQETIFIMEVATKSGMFKITITPGYVPKGDALPLRLDRMGLWLREHLENRESIPASAL